MHTIGDTLSQSNRGHLSPFLETGTPTPEDPLEEELTEEKLLLFFKFYAPADESLKYVGHQVVGPPLGPGARAGRLEGLTGPCNARATPVWAPAPRRRPLEGGSLPGPRWKEGDGKGPVRERRRRSPHLVGSGTTRKCEVGLVAGGQSP